MRADVKARLAADQLAAGHVDAAAKESSQALSLEPDNPARKLLQARVHVARGETPAAMRLLESIPPDAPQAGEADYLLGVIHQQNGEWDRAYACFVRAFDHDPTDLACLTAIVQVLLQRQSAGEALALLRAYEREFAAMPGYHASLAECHEQLRDWPAAAAAWRRVAGGADDPHTTERLALALVRAERWEEATAVLERLLAGTRGNSDLRTANTELRGGPDALSSRTSSPTARSSPFSAGTRALQLALAECLIETGRYEDAHARILPLLDGTAGAVPGLRLLARSFVLQQQPERALRVLEEALRITPSDGAGLELAAALAYAQGDHRRASDWAVRRIRTAAPGADVSIAEDILARCEAERGLR